MRRQKNQAHEERAYFYLIEKVGSWNRYQAYLFSIFAAICILESSLIFAPPFLFNTTGYQCGLDEGDSCTQFVCSLPPLQRKQYLPESPFRSLADDLGVDFRCEYNSMLTFLSTLVFVSSISGMLLFTTFTEGFGRKNSLLLSSSLILAGVILTLLSGYFSSIYLTFIGIVLTYWGTENSFQFIYCFASEVVAEEWRITYINLINVVYGLGMALDAILFEYIQEWTTIYICAFLIPAALVVFSVFFFIEKTPIDLLASEQQTSILQRLRRIATINKLPFDITLQEICRIKTQYINSIKQVSSKMFNCLDLFGYESLRKATIPIIALNFIGSYIFYAPSIINSSPSSNRLKEGLIDGLSYIFAVFCASLFLERMARRSIIAIVCVLTFITEVLLISIGTQTDSLLYTISYFALRLFSSIGYTTIYITIYETFPTQIRAVGAKFAGLSGSLSGVAQPQIVSAFERRRINIIYSFLIITLVEIVPVIYMKETFQIPPPEVIEELIETSEPMERREMQI